MIGVRLLVRFAGLLGAAALPWIGLGFLLAHLVSYGLVNTLLVVGLLVTLLEPSVRSKAFAGWPESSGKALLAFVVWAHLSMLLSPETWVPGAAMGTRVSMKPPLALLFGYAVARSSPGAWSRALTVSSAAMALFVLPCLVTFLQGDVDRMYVIFTYGREILGVNPLGGMCGVLLMLLAARRWRTGTPARARPLEWPVMGLLLAAVLATGSRSALVMLVGICSGYAVWNLQVRSMLRFALGAAVALAAIVAVNPRFVPRLTEGTFLGYEMNLRFLIWRRGLAMIRRHPLVGTGARRYRDAADQYLPSYAVSRVTGLLVDPEAPDAYVTSQNPDELHNDYLTVTALHGVPGLLLWLLVHGALLHAAWRTRSRARGGEEARAREGLAVGAFGFVLGALGYQLFNGVWYNQEFGPFAHFFVGCYLGEEAEVRAAES